MASELGESKGPNTRLGRKGHWQWTAAETRTDLGLSWQVKSFHQGKTLLAHAQGCRTPSGPGSGLGQDRVVCPWADGLRWLTNPGTAQAAILGDFMCKTQTQRADLAARDSELAAR